MAVDSAKQDDLEHAVDIVYSVNGVPIRMTAERWWHIVENHDYLAGYYDRILHTVEAPDLILRGYAGYGKGNLPGSGVQGSWS
jgi:hypothetical protein